MLPDNITNCGNSNAKVSGDGLVTLLKAMFGYNQIPYILRQFFPLRHVHSGNVIMKQNILFSFQHDLNGCFYLVKRPATYHSTRVNTFLILNVYLKTY
jgi:hypothetical protein